MMLLGLCRAIVVDINGWYIYLGERYIQIGASLPEPTPLEPTHLGYTCWVEQTERFSQLLKTDRI